MLLDLPKVYTVTQLCMAIVTNSSGHDNSSLAKLSLCVRNCSFCAVLMDGFTLAGRHHKLLAFSGSQLHDVSAWFFAELPGQLQASSPA